MTRAPWRVGDIGDALLGRSTRPSLPAIAASMGLDKNVNVEALGLECDEVYFMVHENDIVVPIIVIWCMKTGKPWQQ